VKRKGTYSIKEIKENMPWTLVNPTQELIQWIGMVRIQLTKTIRKT